MTSDIEVWEEAFSPEAVAHHEAAHAVAAAALGIGITRVTIVGDEGASGRLWFAVTAKEVERTEWDWNEDMRVARAERRARREIIVAAAGPAATAKLLGVPALDVLLGYPGTGDLQQIEILLDRVDDYEVTEDGHTIDFGPSIRKAAADAETLVAAHWSHIERVAAELLDYKTVSGRRVRQIVRG